MKSRVLGRNGGGGFGGFIQGGGGSFKLWFGVHICVLVQRGWGATLRGFEGLFSAEKVPHGVRKKGQLLQRPSQTL